METCLSIKIRSVNILLVTPSFSLLTLSKTGHHILCQHLPSLGGNGTFCLLSENTYNLGIVMEDAFLPKILEFQNRT